MYDADPFAAQKQVEERQIKAAQVKEQKATGPQKDAHESSISPDFTRTPEVRMSSGLRDLVEDTIKKGRVSVFFQFAFISLFCRPVYFTRYTRHHLWYWRWMTFLQ